MNTHLLVSGAEHFRVDFEINPYMDVDDQPEGAAAVTEHTAIVAAHRAAGRTVEHLVPVAGCPDMVFTANAALVSGTVAVLATLPEQRRPETPHHRAWLTGHGYDVVETPYAFSGQGDALPSGDLLLAAYGQRTDRRVLDLLADRLDYEVVPLCTAGPQWYDLDLAIAVVDEHTLAWHPDAFDELSRKYVRALDRELIEVTREEAGRFALNLVSDAATVTMTDRAPRLAAELRGRGLDVVELATAQLAKGGGGVRCTALTLHPAPNLRPAPRAA